MPNHTRTEHQKPPPHIACSHVTWLRCRSCHRSYFAAAAPSPPHCQACTGGRLQPMALWDLRTDPAQPGMLWRAAADAATRIDVLVCEEVRHE